MTPLALVSQWSRLALGWYGRARAGRVPGSCAGSALLLGEGLGSGPQVDRPMVREVSGSAGMPYTGLAKSKTEVRSPQTWRRQALMLGLVAGLPMAAVHTSRKRSTEVWSKVSELTQPPRLHGETAISGTRKPRPMLVEL